MDVPIHIDLALGKKWCLVCLVHHVGKQCRSKGPDGQLMRCTSCGSGEHHYTICVPNVKGKTNMFMEDDESDEREESDDERPYTKLDDEVGRWELDDWIMDDGSEDRLHYQRCPETGMAFERVLGRTKSRRVAHPRVLLGSRKVTLM